MNANLQYISDTILIEKIYALEFGFSKQAGLFESLGLNGIGSSISGYVKEHVSSDAPGGYVGSVLALLLPAVLWRLNPFVAIVYSIAAGFGFDIESVISKIMDALKPKLLSGQQVSAEEVNSIGKSVIAPMTSSGTLDNDWLEPLRKISFKEEPGLESFALFGSKSYDPSILSKILGSAGGQTKTKLLGGIIIWIIKTVLLSAGLLAGGEFIAGALGHKHQDTSHQDSGSTYSQTPKSTSEESAPKQEQPAPSEQHTTQVPSNQDVWVVPLVGNGTVEDTLKAWALDLYPNLNKYDNIEETMDTVPSFRAIAAFLKKDPKNIGSNSLVMPKELSSRQQVVDFFINDLIKALG